MKLFVVCWAACVSAAREGQTGAFDIRDFGAVAGGQHDNTGAFESAVAAVRAASGGKLVGPPGTWLTTGFNLTSNMVLWLAHGATLLGRADFAPSANGSSVDAIGWRVRDFRARSYPPLNPPGAAAAGGGFCHR